MGTLGGFASPFGPPPTAPTPLASLGLAKPWRSGSRSGDCGSSRQTVGKARLRLRGHDHLRLVGEFWTGGRLAGRGSRGREFVGGRRRPESVCCGPLTFTRGRWPKQRRKSLAASSARQKSGHVSAAEAPGRRGATRAHTGRM